MASGGHRDFLSGSPGADQSFLHFTMTLPPWRAQPSKGPKATATEGTFPAEPPLPQPLLRRGASARRKSGPLGRPPHLRRARGAPAGGRAGDGRPSGQGAQPHPRHWGGQPGSGAHAPEETEAPGCGRGRYARASRGRGAGVGLELWFHAENKRRRQTGGVRGAENRELLTLPTRRVSIWGFAAKRKLGQGRKIQEGSRPTEGAINPTDPRARAPAPSRDPRNPGIRPPGDGAAGAGRLRPSLGSGSRSKRGARGHSGWVLCLCPRWRPSPRGPSASSARSRWDPGRGCPRLGSGKGTLGLSRAGGSLPRPRRRR